MGNYELSNPYYSRTLKKKSLALVGYRIQTNEINKRTN